MQLYSDEANEQNRLVRLLQSKGGRLPQIARNVMFQFKRRRVQNYNLISDGTESVG